MKLGPASPHRTGSLSASCAEQWTYRIHGTDSHAILGSQLLEADFEGGGRYPKRELQISANALPIDLGHLSRAGFRVLEDCPAPVR